MKEIEDASVTEYRDELILELTGTDEHDSFAVISYQFDYDDESQDIVYPIQPIESDHLSIVEDALENEGYRLVAQMC